MVTKIIGYVLSIGGIVGLAYTMVPQLQKYLPFLEGISTTILTAASIVLILIGLFLVIKRSRGRRGGEVPIYRGKHIVGYRRS
jgi:membrane protein DedA with SNARE-associated domain